MGREFIGESSASEEDPELDHLEMELAIKYIKQESGKPPYGVDVEIRLQDHELGSYPVISVVWDDYVAEYPGEYIGKCIEAFERFDLPEEIHQRYRTFFELQRDKRTCMTESPKRNGRSLWVSLRQPECLPCLVHSGLITQFSMFRHSPCVFSRAAELHKCGITATRRFS
jgi:hypothetical protein